MTTVEDGGQVYSATYSNVSNAIQTDMIDPDFE